MSAAGHTAGSLLLVLEPAAGEDAATGRALLAEGARLAVALGVEARLVTWKACGDLDLEALSVLIAGTAERAQPMAVLLADTDMGRRLAPLVAYRLGSGAVLGCSDVLVRGRAGRTGGRGAGRGTIAFVKPVYGGWLEEVIDPVTGSIPIVTLDLPSESDAQVELESYGSPGVLEVPQGASGVRSLELIPPDPGTVDLVHAKRIVAAGSGSTSGESLAAARELADLLEGSVGATRPVVDDGQLPKERLIGQTGRTVTPDLYVALGISGSPHHVAGVKKADRVLAINRDVRAPIFRFSDIGYVADLEAVLPALVRRIKEYRDASGSAR